MEQSAGSKSPTNCAKFLRPRRRGQHRSTRAGPEPPGTHSVRRRRRCRPHCTRDPAREIRAALRPDGGPGARKRARISHERQPVVMSCDSDGRGIMGIWRGLLLGDSERHEWLRSGMCVLRWPGVIESLSVRVNRMSYDTKFNK